jgi:acylphosphatase
VEALLEGEEQAVRGVIAWCREGPPGAKVDRVEVEWEPFRGEFDRMMIRHSA